MIYFKNKFKLYWSCRRGILELDIIINNFYKNYFNYIKNIEKKKFILLLKFSDYLILSWLFNIKSINNLYFKKIILIIRKKNKINL